MKKIELYPSTPKSEMIEITMDNWQKAYISNSQPLTKKDKHLLKQYNQLNWYIKQYKKQVFEWVNPDKQDWEIKLDMKKTNGAYVDKLQKLDNVEVYATNVLNDMSYLLSNWILPMYTSKQQKQFCKQAGHRISTKQKTTKEVFLNGTDTRTPLEIINYYRENKIYDKLIDTQEENFKELERLYKKYKSSWCWKTKIKMDTLLEKIHDNMLIPWN